MNRTFWIMDYETIVNCFIAVFEAYDRDERKVFVINRDRNDALAFIKFLDECIVSDSWHFGYNNIAFDAQITQYILVNREAILKGSSDEVTMMIAQYAGTVINKSRNNEFHDFREEDFSIKVIDIFKLNHWDNPAKRSSLKWIQYSLDWNNVQEMPHKHTNPVLTDEVLNDLIGYCINDVASTKNIFHYKDENGVEVMKEQIRLRSELSKQYGINLYSASEPRISKEMFLHFLSERLNQDKRTIRGYRTSRNKIQISDVLLPYIDFYTPEFKAMFNWFKNLSIEIREENTSDTENKGPKYTMHYKGVETVYGLGGLHGCAKPGIYEATDDMILVTADVTSFYPNLAIRNKWSPAHIKNDVFCELYEWFFEERKKYPKGSTLNYLFKIILNSTYGLSKNVYSFLYDPMFTFRITINGQLLLSMLYEMVITRIPNAEAIMQNTDGCEFIIPKEYRGMFESICKEWEQMTNLELELDEYKKMIISDVNNYIAMYKKEGKEPKCKGRFEFSNLALHKNKSYQVVPKALYAYFVNGIDPKQYIESNRNIYDYCAGAKIKGDWHFVERKVIDGCYIENQLQNLVRYYISKHGVKIIKCSSDGREIQLESGKWLQSIFNVFDSKSWDDYDIDESFYLDKIYREIAKIEESNPLVNSNKQLTLF